MSIYFDDFLNAGRFEKGRCNALFDAEDDSITGSNLEICELGEYGTGLMGKEKDVRLLLLSRV